MMKNNTKNVWIAHIHGDNYPSSHMVLHSRLPKDHHKDLLNILAATVDLNMDVHLDHLHHKCLLNPRKLVQWQFRLDPLDLASIAMSIFGLIMEDPFGLGLLELIEEQLLVSDGMVEDGCILELILEESTILSATKI